MLWAILASVEGLCAEACWQLFIVFEGIGSNGAGQPEEWNIRQLQCFDVPLWDAALPICVPRCWQKGHPLASMPEAEYFDYMWRRRFRLLEFYQPLPQPARYVIATYRNCTKVPLVPCATSDVAAFEAWVRVG